MFWLGYLLLPITIYDVCRSKGYISLNIIAGYSIISLFTTIHLPLITGIFLLLGLAKAMGVKMEWYPWGFPVICSSEKKKEIPEVIE